jgi:hypothetical protein
MTLDADSITLQYAPARRRSTLRRARRALVLSAVMAPVVWGGYAVRERVNALESSPGGGPVDWPAVLTSATLLKAAWELSSNPNAIIEYTEHLEFDLKPPFRFQNGKVHFTVVVHNRGTRPALHPQLLVAGTIPRHVGCSPATVVATFGSYLGKGVQVVDPGEKLSVTLAVPADKRPANTDLTMLLPHAIDAYFIMGGGGRGHHHPYADWSEVPASAVTRE